MPVANDPFLLAPAVAPSPVPLVPGAGGYDAPLTGLLAWYKADSIVANNGDQIQQWNDSSGNGNHAVQPDILKSPRSSNFGFFNGFPSLVFIDGSVLKTPPFQQFPSKRGAVFAAYYVASAGQGTRILFGADQSGSPYFLAYAPLGSGEQDTWSDSAQTYQGAVDLSAQTRISTIHQVDDVTVNFYTRNSMETWTVTNQQYPANGLYIGGASDGGSFIGYLAELMFYSDITDDQRQAAYNYLLAKYGA